MVAAAIHLRWQQGIGAIRRVNRTLAAIPPWDCFASFGDLIMYKKIGTAAAWLSDGSVANGPAISVSVTLTRADLRTLWERAEATVSDEVKFSVGLFDNARYIEGTKTPAYTGNGSIRTSVEPVRATPPQAQALQRTVMRQAEAGLSAQAPAKRRGRPLGSKNRPKNPAESVAFTGSFGLPY